MKKYILSFFLASFLLLPGSFLTAQEVEVLNLTIDKAVEIALENNVSIKKGAIDLSKLKTADRFSWNSISPSFSASGTWSSNLEENTDTLSLTASANMNLSTNLFSTMRAARLAYENGELSYQQAKRNVELSVRKTFYALLYEGENIELQKRGLETSKIQYETNQEKFKNGKISELDVMTSRVSYQQKKPLVESAEITFKNDLSSFKQVLGLDQNVEIKLSGTLDEVLKIKPISLKNLPETEGPAPDVKSAEKALQIAENTLLASRFSAYGPTVSASFRFSENNAHKRDAMGQPTSETAWSDSKTLSVGVNIPLDGILPWSNSSASIKSNKKSVESAKLTLENTKTSIKVQTENYMRKINQSIGQIDSLMANVDLARETYNLSKTAYNYGKTDILSLQSASDSLLSASVSVKQQAYSLISSILDFEYLLGIPYGTLSK